MAAERYGRERQDDCDKATAEELVCTTLRSGRAASTQTTFVQELRSLQERDQFVWRGVYDDERFDRHVRAYIRKLTKMAKTNEGFANLRRYQ